MGLSKGGIVTLLGFASLGSYYLVTNGVTEVKKYDRVPEEIMRELERPVLSAIRKPDYSDK